MALWEIRLVNQNPVRVEVEDDRNLCEEYEAFEAWHTESRWRFWQACSPYWRVTDEVLLHKDVVTGVVPKRPKPAVRELGFLSRG